MSTKGRALRVAELIREEVGKLLTKGLKDPRIGFVSVMGVRMSPDLQYANVYVSLYGSDKEKKSSLIGLQNSQGWVRREIGKHLRMRVTPEIRFYEDDTLDKVYELENLFEEIHHESEQMPMNHISLEVALDDLKAAGSFLITAHVNPDGDAVGSMLGLYHLLKKLGKKNITLMLSDPVPKVFRNLPGADKIVNAEEAPKDYELAVILDVAQMVRTGDVAKHIPAGKKVLVIDHHLVEEPDGTVGFIDPTYAATGELIFELFKIADVHLDQDAAHCLCVAQITDTGGFRYSNTNARSHRIAAEIVETGLDVPKIAHQVFDIITLPKFKLLRIFLDRLELASNGRLAWSWLTAEDLAEAEGRREDLDGLVNYARNIEGVVVGAIFTNLDENVSKVSLRSEEEFNAATFLNQFGGGGHAAAAGATIQEPIEAVRDKVLKALETALED